jgi:acetoin utilization protein AcuB
MSKKITMEDVMTPTPHTVGPDQSLAIALELMRTHNIRHLPVRHEGRITGILSERDINFALRIERTNAEGLTVESALTPEVFSVLPSTPVADVAARMGSERIGCALVEDSLGKLLGIFTSVDACRVLAQQIN